MVCGARLRCTLTAIMCFPVIEDARPLSNEAAQRERSGGGLGKAIPGAE